LYYDAVLQNKLRKKSVIYKERMVLH